MYWSTLFILLYRSIVVPSNELQTSPQDVREIELLKGIKEWSMKLVILEAFQVTLDAKNISLHHKYQ